MKWLPALLVLTHAVPGRGDVVAIALDGASVYYADARSVVRVPKTGGAPTVLARDQEAPSALALRDGFLYWGNTGDGAIRRMPQPGGRVETLATLKRAPCYLAVDETDVFAAGDGFIVRIPRHGGKPVELATSKGSSAGLALDGRHVYWAHAYGCAGCVPAAELAIVRIPKAGGPAESLGVKQPIGDGAMAVAGEWVYWTFSVRDDIGLHSGLARVPMSGGPGATLYTGHERLAGLALDAQNAYISDPQGGRILAVPLSGGPAGTLASGEAFPSPPVIDSERVYWVAGGALKGRSKARAQVVALGAAEQIVGLDGSHVWIVDKEITRRVPRGGGPPVTVPRVPTPQLDGARLDDSLLAALVTPGIQVAPGVGVDRTHAYVPALNPHSSRLQILKVARRDGRSSVWMEWPSLPMSVAVDARTVYWAAAGSGSSDGQVVARAKSGGPARVLAAGLSRPHFITTDADHVYVSGVDGAILKIPKAGGGTSVLASGQRDAYELAVEGGFLYYTMSNAVMKVPKRGGEPAPVATGQHDPRGLTATAEGCYFTSRGALMFAPAEP